MKIIRGIQQGTQEWLDLRTGRVTASRFKDIMTSGKGTEFGATFDSYVFELAIEKITGECVSSYKSEAMQRGNDMEPIAALRYCMESGETIEEITGILVNDDVWISPDRLSGEKGLLEIKCPNTTTHVKYTRGEGVPSAHDAQVQGQLWGAEREWNAFVSYDDRWKLRDYFCFKAYRDEDFIKKLESRIKIAIEKRDALIYELKNYKDGN
jgi:predicted phage-related endonuclease